MHDEQDLLPRCLDALRRAIAAVSDPVHIALVLDACSDASPRLARTARLGARTLVVAVEHGCVGSARAAGCTALLDDLGADGWLWTTDADSVVPLDWLQRGLRYASAGFDAVAGTVVVDDWSRWAVGVQVAYEDQYVAADGLVMYADAHRHVHGANLGVAAAAYRAVGGFGPLACHEDVALVSALLDTGRRVAWGTDLAVLTSGRTRGRVPSGFSGHLRALQRTVVCRSVSGVGIPRN